MGQTEVDQKELLLSGTINYIPRFDILVDYLSSVKCQQILKQILLELLQELILSFGY